jgi:hypothetical protein
LTIVHVGNGNILVADHGLLRDPGGQRGGGGGEEDEEDKQGDREADPERQTGKKIDITLPYYTLGERGGWECNFCQ